jgi:hypothetical protein
MTAAYYGRDLKDEVIKMMASDLEDLSFEEVIQAFQNYRRDPKNRTFPLPAHIRDMISPTMTKDAEAREILGRIKSAIKVFGGYQSAPAQTYIGPIGWKYIQEQGGWFNFCFHINIFDESALQAQARERLIDLCKFGSTLAQVDRPQVSREEKFQLERQRQTDMVDDWKIKIEKSKPDPNEGYLSKTKEEQKAFIKDFLEKLNANQQEPGETNG